MADHTEDTLASAFDNSFSLPHAPHREEAPKNDEPVADPAPTEEAEETPAANLDDWRASYEANLATWQAEADEAREKSEATRKKYEDEHAAAARAVADAAKAAKAAEKEEKDRKEREARLAAALAEEVPKPHYKRVADAGKVREAWELVKESKDKAAPKEEHESKEGSVDVTNKTQSVASGTWEEISAPHSSVEDISQVSPATATQSSASEKPKSASTSTGVVPTKSAAAAAGAHVPAPGHESAAETPSLTLSIFTAPGQITLSRVVAALGINLVLPFINGIMLGLGEITAREAVRVGRLWWRGERAIAGFWRRNDGGVSKGPGSGAANVSGVGLSGSGGF